MMSAFASCAGRSIAASGGLFVRGIAARNNVSRSELYWRVHFPVTRHHRFSSTSISDTSISKASSSLSSTVHPVVKLTPYGDILLKRMTVSDILKGCTMLARDLFSLALNTRTAESNPSDNASIGMRHPPPVILPRKEEVLIAFGNTRALVKKDAALVFDGHKPNVQLFAGELASYFEEKTEEMLQANRPNNGNNVRIIYPDDFEIIFIEEVIRETCDSFYRRLRIYEPIVSNLMSKVDQELFSTAGVQHLVPLSDSLQEFEMVVSQCLECLQNLLKNDDDMLGLLLTKRAEANKKGSELSQDLHEEVELMLEAYAGQLSALRREINYLQSRVQSKTNFLKISLDSYRNRMIRMDVYIGIMGMGLGICTTTAGFYGMNLIHGLEESPTAFFTVVVASGVASLATIAGCSSYLSSKSLKQAAMHRAAEIESISNALGDMTSVDYAVKTMMLSGVAMDKNDFSERLAECHSMKGSIARKEGEVSLLFEMLDATKDGYIDKDDFQCMQSFIGHRRKPKVIVDVE